MTIPVVLIHRGKSERYPLATVITQARKFDNDIVLIGDEANGATERLDDYFSVASDFATHYAHLSTNHVEFERFCIQRWFVLREWMVKREVDDCLYIDSDVLLFCNAGDEFGRWGSGYDFTLSLSTSPASSYFSRDGLYEFCNWAYKVYSERGAIFEEFQRVFNEMRRQNLPGGICDMTLLKFYRALIGAERIGEMTRVFGNSSWDHALPSGDGYFVRDGLKAIEFFNGFPYGQRLSDGAPIQFLCLHCQGGAKNKIKEYAR